MKRAVSTLFAGLAALVAFSGCDIVTRQNLKEKELASHPGASYSAHSNNAVENWRGIPEGITRESEPDYEGIASFHKGLSCLRRQEYEQAADCFVMSLKFYKVDIENLRDGKPPIHKTAKLENLKWTNFYLLAARSEIPRIANDPKQNKIDDLIETEFYNLWTLDSIYRTFNEELGKPGMDSSRRKDFIAKIFLQVRDSLRNSDSYALAETKKEESSYYGASAGLVGTNGLAGLMNVSQQKSSGTNEHSSMSPSTKVDLIADAERFVRKHYPPATNDSQKVQADFLIGTP